MKDEASEKVGIGVDPEQKEEARADLIPASQGGELSPTVGTGIEALAGNDRRTGRALAEVQRNTLEGMASVQGHAMVQVGKIHEIDRLSREATSGQAMLAQWAATLAHGDALVADDLRFFTDLARMGKGEVIAEAISDFCQEVPSVIILVVFRVLAVALVVALMFVLGFRPGGQSWIAEAQCVPAVAAAAERQLHDITRAAFVAMAEEAEALRNQGRSS